MDCNHGKPRVAYKEALASPLQYHAAYKRQTGGKGSFAVMDFRLDPLPYSEKGLKFQSEVKGGAIPKEYLAGAEKGFKLAIF